MDLGDLIKPDGVIAHLQAPSKKVALSELAARAAELLKRDKGPIFEALWQRERLSSTGIGKGIAIPHCQLSQLTGMFGMFARLDHAIDFEAMDEQPVDLVFLLLSPEAAGADHLKALARISRLMRDPPTLEKLRATKSRAAIYSILTEPMASNAA